MTAKCETDWTVTERSVAATAGHVDRRQVVFSCQVRCVEGVSNRMTPTVRGYSDVARPFLSGLSVSLSVAAKPNIQSNDATLQAVMVHCV